MSMLRFPPSLTLMSRSLLSPTFTSRFPLSLTSTRSPSPSPMPRPQLLSPPPPLPTLRLPSSRLPPPSSTTTTPLLPLLPTTTLLPQLLTTTISDMPLLPTPRSWLRPLLRPKKPYQTNDDEDNSTFREDT